MDKDFERKYSVEVPKLDFGENFEQFEIDSSFFGEFKDAPVDEGQVDVKATIYKYQRHLNAKFHFSGHLILNCDRCLEPYKYDLDFEQEVVYSFDEDLEFDTDDVVLISEGDPRLYLGNDFYDFISLQVPLRRVPPEEIHTCPEEVLTYLGLQENPVEAPEEEKEIDPRWAALKKLKEDTEDKLK